MTTRDAPGKKQKMERTKLTDRLTAVAEGLLRGAVAKAERGERWGWHSGLTSLGFDPASAVTGRAYVGRWNTLFLRVAQAFGNEPPSWDGTEPENPYTTGWLATYQQWEGLGAQARKGEKSSHMFVPRTFNTCQDHGLTKKKCDECQSFDVMRKYFRMVSVFNADQVDGWDPPEMEVPEGTDRVETWIERIHQRSPIEIRFRPDAFRGSFQPTKKRITLPTLGRFQDAAMVEDTLCHELAHATSVLPGTERETSTEFGSLPYAREELIAESAGWLMGLSAGRAPSGNSCNPEDNSVSYLANWAGKFSPEELDTEISSIAKQAVAASRAGFALISDETPIGQPLPPAPLPASPSFPSPKRLRRKRLGRRRG